MVTPNDIRLMILEAIQESIADRELEHDLNQLQDELHNEWYGGQKHQSWKLVPARDLLITWNTFAKYGRVDEKKLDMIWNIVKSCVIKILLNSDISNGSNPEFFGHDTYDDITKEDWDRWATFISDNSGTNWGRGSLDWGGNGMGRYTDVGRHLFKLLDEAYKADTPENKLIAIDRILNFVHGSEAMAKWFVEGGTNTLNKIRDFEVKGIHLTGKLFEAADPLGKDYLGTTYGGTVQAVPVKNAHVSIHNDFNMISGRNSENWRYLHKKNKVLWNNPPTEEDKMKVDEFLAKRGITNVTHKNMYEYGGKYYKQADFTYESFDSSFESNIRPGETAYVEIFKNPTSREIKEVTSHEQFGLILTEMDAYVWNRDKAYHSQVMKHLNKKDALPLQAYVETDGLSVMVTDASRHGDWHHNPHVVGFIMAHPFFRGKHLKDISFWDEDIVGNWADLSVNENTVERLPIRMKDLGNNVVKRIPPKSDDFVVGKYYDAGDVLDYVMDIHGDFWDFDRVEGVFKCEEVDPKSIEESEWHIDDFKVKQLSQSTRSFPTIVIDVNGSIIDGGHRLAAAVLRGDQKIKVLRQIK